MDHRILIKDFIYENLKRVKSSATIIPKDDLIYIKIGKRIISTIHLKDIIVHGKIDLDRFFSWLENIADNNGTKKFQ